VVSRVGRTVPRDRGVAPRDQDLAPDDGDLAPRDRGLAPDAAPNVGPADVDLANRACLPAEVPVHRAFHA